MARNVNDSNGVEQLTNEFIWSANTPQHKVYGGRVSGADTERLWEGYKLIHI